MMQKRIVLMLLCLLIGAGTIWAAKKKKTANEAMEKTMYLFGVAKNYGDSISVMTAIFPMERVALMPNKAVANLEMYTEQLSLFFKLQGQYGYICATYYADSYKDAEKKYLKVRKRFRKETNLTLQTLSNDDFKYEYVDSKQIYRNDVSISGE